MFKFVFITDPHISTVTPTSRTDDYIEALFKKFEYVFEFCKRKNVKVVICGGDLFDSPNQTDAIVNRLIELIKKYDIKIHTIFGNHDMRNANLSSIGNTKIGIMRHFEWFVDLQENPIINNDVCVYGKHYTKSTSCCDTIEFDIKKQNKIMIAVLHTMVGKENLLIGGKRKVIHYRDFNVYPKFDIVLTGHYHPGYGVKKVDGIAGVTYYANPASLGRTSLTDCKTGMQPGLVYGKVQNGQILALKRYPIPYNKTAFDIEKHIEHIEHVNTRNQFIDILNSFKDAKLFNTSLMDKLDHLENNMPEQLKERTNKSLLDEIRRRLQDE